jgi:hypothetical protein
MTHFNIVNGPSKFDLMVSLFEEGNPESPHTVKFVLEDGREANVAITMIQKEDGSGESWNYVGRGDLGGRIWFHMNGYFSSRTRRGTLNIV